MQAAAVAGGAALAELLSTATQGQQAECGTPAKAILRCFLYPFRMVYGLVTVLSAAPVVKKFGQRVKESPQALPSTVEAFRACRTDNTELSSEVRLIAESIDFHMNVLDSDPAEPALYSSDALEQYALEALATAAAAAEAAAAVMISMEASPNEYACGPAAMDSFKRFLAIAVEEGGVHAARMRALLTHEGILAPLRAAAQG